jgi:hypothetical protein
MRCCVQYTPQAGGSALTVHATLQVLTRSDAGSATVTEADAGGALSLSFDSTCEDVLCTLGPPDAVLPPSAVSAKLLIHRRRGRGDRSGRASAAALQGPLGQAAPAAAPASALRSGFVALPPAADAASGQAGADEDALPDTWRYRGRGLDVLVDPARARVVGWCMHANAPG